LVAGITALDAPFSFLRNNTPVGIDIALATRFAASIGRPITFNIMTFGGLIPALVSGKIDMMASAAMLTPERMRQVAFSQPYMSVGSTVLALKAHLTASPAPLRDGSDVPTARIAALTGSTSEIFLENEYPQAQLLLFDDVNDAFQSLLSNKADYVLTSFTTALLATKRHPQMVMLPKEYLEDNAGIALNKRDTALLRQIDNILLRYKRDGTLDDLIDRWIKPDGSDYQPIEIPKVPDGKPIRVGMAANREPMCFISNGKVMGLDAELIERIAYELGRPVNYFDMKFSSLIAALESSRIDLIISNIMITPERLKRVNFSEPYYPNPQVMTTLSAHEIARPNLFARVRESFINNIVVEKRYLMIVEGLKQTLIITLFSILLGTIVGGVICFLRMSRNRLSVGFAKLYINVMRGTPILVLLMLFFYVLFASSSLSATVVAIITFALNMGAYSSEMFRTAIQSVDKGQSEAGIALGFTKIQTFIYVVMPQALKRVVPVYKGEVISLLKMTSIVGYIAVVDLTKASDIIRSRTFDAFFPLILVAILYFTMAWLLGFALDKFNQKMTTSA
jgi:polar amino acid transport system substrate-binding protein